MTQQLQEDKTEPRANPPPVRLLMGEAWMMCRDCNGKLFSFDGEEDASRSCPYRGRDGKCNPRQKHS